MLRHACFFLPSIASASSSSDDDDSWWGVRSILSIYVRSISLISRNSFLFSSSRTWMSFWMSWTTCSRRWMQCWSSWTACACCLGGVPPASSLEKKSVRNVDRFQGRQDRSVALGRARTGALRGASDRCSSGDVFSFSSRHTDSHTWIE